jgi:hypothetical protein
VAHGYAPPNTILTINLCTKPGIVPAKNKTSEPPIRPRPKGYIRPAALWRR